MTNTIPDQLPFRSPVFALSLACSALCGATINALPVTFKVFEKLFAANYEMQGRTASLHNLGGLLGVLIVGAITLRFGITVAARLSLVIGGAGCFLLASAAGFDQVQIGAGMMGMGSMALGTVYGALNARYFQGSRQRVFAANALAMALSGASTPFLLGRYVSHAWLDHQWPWWIPYSLLGAIFWTTYYFVPCVPHSVRPDVRGANAAKSSLTLLRSGALWLIALGTVLHGVGQASAIVWLGRLHEARFALAESDVGTMIGVNLAGFVTGRLMWAKLGGRLEDRVLLAFSATVGACFYLLTITATSFEMALVYVCVAGFGMSGDGIALQSFTAVRFRENSEMAFSFTQALGLIGSAAGPFVIGLAADRSGTLERMVWLIPVTIGSLALLASSWYFVDRGVLTRRRPEAISQRLE